MSKQTPVDSVAAAGEETENGRKRKTPDDDKTETDAVVKLLDQYQRGTRKLLVRVVQLLKEYKIPSADEFAPLDEDGCMHLKWKQKAALYLTYECSPLITVDVGNNPQLEFEDPRQAIRTLAALLNVQE